MAVPIPIRATSQLSKLALFTRCPDVIGSEFLLAVGEEVFGAYRNDLKVATRMMLVTNNGLHIQSDTTVRFVSYGDISQILWFTWERDELAQPDNRRLVLEIKSGERLEIFVVGSQGASLDVITFHSFLLAAVQTRQLERKRTVNR